MRRYILPISVFLIAGFFNYSYSQDASRIAEGVLKKYAEALSSSSSKNISRVFHSSAVLLPNNSIYVQGRKGISNAFKGLESLEFNESFQVMNAFEEGEVIIVQTENRGKWKNPKTSDSGEFSSKGLMILKQDTDQEWKIFMYAFNDNPSK